MKIADLEHLENVTKPNQSIQGGLTLAQAFANAQATKYAWVLTWTHTFEISL